MRHSKQTDSTTRTHLWDGQEIVAEEMNGSVTDRYLRGTGLVAREQDGRLQYYLHNGHADVTERTDEAGTALKRYDYDAYGKEQGQEKLDSNPYRYCGEYYDKESESIYLRARSYDPVTGRFKGEDSVRWLTLKLPNGQEVTDPLSLNLYTYGHNNPIENIDRAGNFSIGNIFNGVFMSCLGYAAITAGMAALTVATGGAALLALGTVALGVGAMSIGASEVIEGVTDYNPMRVAMGDQLYADSVMLTSMGSAAGMQFSSQYYQMYGGVNNVSPASNRLDFDSQKSFDAHYTKHGTQIQRALQLRTYSAEEYLNDANYIARHGIYVTELNGYIKFISGQKYGFVGIDRLTGEITTFHIKEVSQLAKLAPSLGFGK